MKYQHLVSLALAAALLTGCGGTQSSPSGNLSEMRMGTLEYNALENVCLLLPQQDRLVLRGKYCPGPAPSSAASRPR